MALVPRRALGVVLVADATLEWEMFVGLLRGFPLLWPGLHWHPRAMLLFPVFGLSAYLALDAAVPFLVLALAFVVFGVVFLTAVAFLEFAALVTRRRRRVHGGRAGALRGCEGAEPTASCPWGSSTDVVEAARPAHRQSLRAPRRVFGRAFPTSAPAPWPVDV